MKKFEILEHKADLQIRVFGRTKEELFQNALFGMQESMKPEIRKPDKETKRKIKIIVCAYSRGLLASFFDLFNKNMNLLDTARNLLLLFDISRHYNHLHRS